MTTRHQMQDELAREHHAAGDIGILQASTLQRMSQWELEAEIAAHTDHERIHPVAVVERRYARTRKIASLGSAIPRYQPGYRRGKLNARQKPWIT
jgi:hypothetical protein